MSERCPREASRRRLLDLFCGAGGAAMGYHRAGFDVVGVDIEPQPDYPFEFVQADAMDWLHDLTEFPVVMFDAIHASPPCQRYTSLAVTTAGAGDYPALLAEVIALLRACRGGLPWVVENVEGARDEFPRDVYRFQLCGSMFGPPLNRTRRHRWFASSVPVMVPSCQHGPSAQLIGVYGASDGAHDAGFKHPGSRRGPRQATTIEAREVMGMPWVTKRRGLTEAIPPAFTEHIGGYLMRSLTVKEAA